MTKQTKAYVALVFICIVWGTTYLAIRIGVLHYPAFLFAGVRQTIAGIILMTAALFINKQRDFTKANVLRQMLVGFLMLSIGNGCVTWGEKFIPSGISALICSLTPLFAVMINLATSKKDRLNWIIGLGMLLGISGVGLIFRNNLDEVTKPAYLGGMFATLLATTCWATGSIINKKNVNPVNAFLNSGMQLLFGGLFMLMISPVADDYSGFQLWNADGIMALVYLIIFGSALAYAAYMYALSALPVGIATLYAYVNPLIAVLAGALFLKETLNIYTALAFTAIVISVYLVNKGYRKQHEDSTTNSQIAGGFPESVPAES
jgi:drug/metabolite transporter (DMT)-like permease